MPPHEKSGVPATGTPEKTAQETGHAIEAGVVGSLLADWPDVLPPNLARLLHDAPESCTDARNGAVLETMRQCAADGEEVNVVTVGRRVKYVSREYLCLIIGDTLPISIAEAEAGPLLTAYELRQTKNILADGLAELDASPQHYNAIADATRRALEANRPADGLAQRLASRVYSPQVRPPEPTPRFGLAGIPICTPANLTTISAQAKAGKSAAMGAMMASTFADNDADCLGFQSTNPSGHAVLHVDTEQCPFDHWEGVQRVARRAGMDAPAWLRSYCLTGFPAAEVRQSIRLLTEQAAKDFGGVHSVILDGTADGTLDVNDPAEANSLVAELHALAIKFDCPILNIIHVNPGSDFKTRGHLGSQLERKSETNLRLEKDGDGITVIYADKNRRAPIPKATAPRFAWSDQAGMHVSVASQKNSKAEAEKRAMLTEAEAVFSAAGISAISYGKFIEFLMREVHASKSTAKRRFNEMLQTQIIRKELLGFYALTQK